MTVAGSSSPSGQFSGSIPALYERLLVPMIFAEPAQRLARTVAETEPATILETAAGTGVLTRALTGLCRHSEIVATDVHDTMLAVARQRGGSTRGLRWEVADALNLPFADRAFDAVVCQFGAMFFPDRRRGFAEARRVLRPGKRFFFTVWDRIEANELAHAVRQALLDQPHSGGFTFLTQTPHGYADPDRIRLDLEHAGLPIVSLTRVTGRCTTTAAQAATAYCQATPVRHEIESDEVLDLAGATSAVTAALESRFGTGPFTTATSWFEITAHE